MTIQKHRIQLMAAIPAALLTITVLAVTVAAPGCATSTDSEPVADLSRAEALFVENCASCHGVSGDGRGPMASLLQVRPRNFSDEEFRYVSAPGGPPTQDDLVQTIRGGRTMGQMPAFPYLDHTDARLLADYVRKLRETGVAKMLVVEFADDDEIEPDEIAEIAEERVAPGDPVAIVGPSAEFRIDTERGRALYADNCSSCHGASGRGDGLDLPKDELGNPIEVRDITSGRFNGGAAPMEMFKRIRCGIPGTPMPEASALSNDEVWQLVHYVDLLAGN